MIVLDTHIWLWWVNDDSSTLKAEWRELIDNASEVGVSAISCFEVAWLERHSRIALPQPRTTWFEKALDGSGISLLPVSAEITTTEVDLPEHHSDPLKTGLLSRQRLFWNVSLFLLIVNSLFIKRWSGSF